MRFSTYLEERTALLIFICMTSSHETVFEVQNSSPAHIVQQTTARSAIECLLRTKANESNFVPRGYLKGCLVLSEDGDTGRYSEEELGMHDVHEEGGQFISGENFAVDDHVYIFENPLETTVSGATVSEINSVPSLILYKWTKVPKSFSRVNRVASISKSSQLISSAKYGPYTQPIEEYSTESSEVYLSLRIPALTHSSDYDRIAKSTTATATSKALLLMSSEPANSANRTDIQTTMKLPPSPATTPRVVTSVRIVTSVISKATSPVASLEVFSTVQSQKNVMTPFMTAAPSQIATSSTTKMASEVVTSPSLLQAHNITSPRSAIAPSHMTSMSTAMVSTYLATPSILTPSVLMTSLLSASPSLTLMPSSSSIIEEGGNGEGGDGSTIAPGNKSTAASGDGSDAISGDGSEEEEGSADDVNSSGENDSD